MTFYHTSPKREQIPFVSLRNRLLPHRHKVKISRKQKVAKRKNQPNYLKQESIETEQKTIKTHTSLYIQLSVAKPQKLTKNKRKPYILCKNAENKQDERINKKFRKGRRSRKIRSRTPFSIPRSKNKLDDFSKISIRNRKYTDK